MKIRQQNTTGYLGLINSNPSIKRMN